MLNILMVCGAGLGSSFACQMSVETVLQDLGVEAKFNHCDISSAAGMRADIIISGKNFEPQFKQYSIDAEKIFLNRLIDKAEIKEKLVPVLRKFNVEV